MIRYHCDRCDDEVSGSGALVPVWIESTQKTYSALCVRCVQELKHWLVTKPARVVTAASLDHVA